jgi:hypothetical protein
MRLAVKVCVILVILASICEVNHAKKRGGSSSRPSSSSSSGSRPSSSSSSGSRPSSSGSGSSLKTRITNALKPKPSGSRPSSSGSGSSFKDKITNVFKPKPKLSGYVILHGLHKYTTDAFFHRNPKLLSLGRQFGQIYFGVFLAHISTPILVHVFH